LSSAAADPDPDRHRPGPGDAVGRAERPYRLVGVVGERLAPGDDEQRAVLRAAQDRRAAGAPVQRQRGRARARPGAARQRAVADQLLGDPPHDMGGAGVVDDRAGAAAVAGPEHDRRALERGLRLRGEREQRRRGRREHARPQRLHGAHPTPDAAS